MDRGKKKVRVGRREDLLPSLQIAYTAKEHARAPRKREIGLCGGEREDKTIKISVLSGKSIFSIDAKAITSDVDVQKVWSGIFE